MSRSVAPDELKRAGLKNWSALAMAVGVTPTAISMVRLGKRPLSPSMRERIAAALDVPETVAEWLMLGKEGER